MNISDKMNVIKFILGIVAIVFLMTATAVLVKNPFGKSALPAVITVSGKGEIQAIPDISRFTITVSEKSATQSEALAKTSEKINAVILALTNAGIAEKDIQTENVSTYPEYEYARTVEMYPPTGSQKLVGYTSSHTLSVKVRTLDLVPTVQQIFADQKITTVFGPELSVDDVEVLGEQARELAIFDAKEQAKILAKQLGVRVGKIVAFSENTSAGTMPLYRMESAMDMSIKSSEPTIAKGEQTITAQVSVTYRIK